MTINIELGPDEEEALSQRARGSGRDLTEYVHQILQEHIRATARTSGPPKFPRSWMTSSTTTPSRTARERPTTPSP